ICWPGDDWRPAHGHVLVSTPGLLSPMIFGGRTVEIDGVIHKPQPPTAPGLFDYGAFLARQRIYYQFTTLASNDWRMLDESQHPRPPLADRFSTWAMTTLARGLPAEDKPLELLWAMTLGWKSAFGGDVADPFMRSGTMHVFAISGLHIALITSL